MTSGTGNRLASQPAPNPYTLPPDFSRTEKENAD